MEIKLSIIVPVYNVEELLPKCIDSILAQSFETFELILVNDGSTDNSGNICNTYAAADLRVRTIHKQNGGTSSARNAGLEIAKGKYIGFVDSDDYIDPCMYETLYETAINYESDIVICDYKEVYGGDYPPKMNQTRFEVTHFDNVGALRQMYLSKSKYIAAVVPWNKLYKRHLFDRIRYQVGLFYDDETVAHKLLYNCKKVTAIHSKLYFYNQREGSQMHSSFHIKRLDKVYILKERATYFKNKRELDIYEKALKHYMDMFFWYYYLAKSELRNIDKDLKEMKTTFDDSLIQLLCLKGISWRQKTMCFLFSLHPYLFEAIRDMKSKNQNCTK